MNEMIDILKGALVAILNFIGGLLLNVWEYANEITIILQWMAFSASTIAAIYTIRVAIKNLNKINNDKKLSQKDS